MSEPLAAVKARRHEATMSFVRYFALVFLVVLTLSGFTAYAVVNSLTQRSQTHALRMEYCHEIEKLKTQNREDVALAKKSYKRNLRLLGLKDSPELHAAAKAGWTRSLRRNAPKACPYRASD